MTSGHAALDLVVQTASGILTGRFAPREAVTIIASQVPEARAEAVRLAERDPERAPVYAALLGSVRAALLDEEAAGDPNRRSVVADLEGLEQALSGGGS